MSGAVTAQANEAQPAAERKPSGNVGLDDAEPGEGGEGPDDDDFEQQMRASAMAKRKAFGKPEAPRPKVSLPSTSRGLQYSRADHCTRSHHTTYLHNPGPCGVMLGCVNGRNP